MSKYISYFAVLVIGISAVMAVLCMAYPAEALSVYQTVQGGTGTSTPSGILYGDNGTTGHLNTVTIGSNLTFSGGTLSATGGGSSFGYPFVGNATSTALTFSGGLSAAGITNSALGAGTVNSTAAGLEYVTATSTPTVTAPITYSGTLGAFIGGITGTFDCIAATGSVKGCLTAADWTTFNNKQGAITLTTTGTSGAATFIANTLNIPQYTGGTGSNFFTQTGNNLQNNTGNALGINVAPNLAALEVQGTTSDATSRALQLWNSSATSLLTVRDDGRVGIGSSSPVTALSVVGTSTFNGDVAIGGDSTGTPNPYLFIGTSTSRAPFYGRLQGDLVDAEYDWNGQSSINVANSSIGSCASATFFADGNNPTLGGYFGTFSFLNDGWTGVGCSIGVGTAQKPEAVAIASPTGEMDFVIASTTNNGSADFNWFSNTNTQLMKLNNVGDLLIGTTTTILSPTFLSPTLVNIVGSPGNGGKMVRINGTSAGIMFAVGSDSTTTDAFSIQTSGNPTGNGINIFTNLPGSGVAIQTNSANANEALSITPKGTGSVTIGNTTSGSSIWNVGLGATVSIRTNGGTIASLGGTSSFTTTSGSGATGRFLITGTTQAGPITANSPYQNVIINDGFNVTHAASTLGIITVAQNEVSITPHTDLFPTGTSIANSTIASSSTLFLAGPSAPGAFANVTNAYGLFIGPGVGTFTSASTTFAAAFSAVAPSGAATNAVSTTTGRVWMNGLTTSASTQSVLLCGSTASGGEVIAESVACVASAKRYKTDIKTLSGSLAKLMKLRPVSFKWKADFNKGFESDPNKTGTQYSLIADEVQNVEPNLAIVTTATTTFEGVTYAPGTVQGLQDSNHWAGFLVDAIQEQQKEIEALGGGITKSLSDEWQWWAIGGLGVLVLFMLGWMVSLQMQLTKLKK